MPTRVHYIDVGQGNMVLIQADDGKNLFFDCNITDDNEDRVLRYVRSIIGYQSIHAFICSHRDADHMRGVRKLHNQNTIHSIWDSEYPGTTTDSSEYLDYMALRRQVGAIKIERKTHEYFGRTHFRYMSAQDDRLAENANAQGIVIKVEHMTADQSSCLASTILTADSDAETWRYAVMEDYNLTDFDTSILMGGHHGSITFFDDPADEENYYTGHIKAMKPEMTIISVGQNGHGHPNPDAIKLYKKYSSGSSKCNKVYQTDTQGTIKLELKDAGGWTLWANQ